MGTLITLQNVKGLPSLAFHLYGRCMFQHVPYELRKSARETMALHPMA